MKSARIRYWATVSLVFMFLVILAGSVVRATGSGMGCPDWPKCFGYTVPPADIETLTWREGKSFKEGQMILLEEKFWVANSDLTTGTDFDETKWTYFDNHDYTIFNPVHTWIEYINRLMTVLAGLPVAILAIFSLLEVKRSSWNTILSFGVLALLLFEAWLGKVVVDGNLVPNQITIHMMGAVSIVLLLLALRSRNTEGKIYYPKSVIRGLVIMLVLTIVQIFLGAQTRELVDYSLEQNVVRTEVMDSMESILPVVHRSFAWSILLMTSILFFLQRKHRVSIAGFGPLVFAIAMEWAVGVVLFFTGLPKVMQPVHLVLSIGILASISYPLFLAARKT